ncbi:MAG: NAD(P)H-dependent glycerol-3-phosphate dehydrogenase [Proteobacteria bacterium]|nr:NAD(P)H-dependent glycerol-3-phosphate dehydrogenase [Pseudomonadota bacterium]
MNNIAVLGLGNFGTALAHNWLEAGRSVSGWTVEQEVYDSISQRGINEKYLKDITLDGLKVSMSIAEAVADAELVVLALPSGVVLSVVEDLIPHLRNEQVILDLAKGLAPDDNLISDDIRERLEAASLTCPLCVMMGPTIAPELAHGVYTTALITSDDPDLAADLAASLTTATLRLTPGKDSLGSEYWGAFKNVIALACGVVDGLKQDGRGGDNLKAAVFTAGFREAVHLLPQLGADPETALSPAGIGDLFVTATSPHGRNREMGDRIGRGQTLEQAQKEMHMVSEGVRAAHMFQKLFHGRSIPCPFVDAVCALLDGSANIDEFLEKAVG